MTQSDDWNPRHLGHSHSQRRDEVLPQSTLTPPQPDSPPRSEHTNSARTQPDQLGSYGLPLQASASRLSQSCDNAVDLASPLRASSQDQAGRAQPQFMSGLMGLHGVTTPEEKQRREDKQKQYARELDEQVTPLM